MALTTSAAEIAAAQALLGHGKEQHFRGRRDEDDQLRGGKGLLAFVVADSCDAGPAKLQARGEAVPTKGKRKRKSYSDEDKRRIIEADRAGGRAKRLQVARALGMPASTADHLIMRANGDQDAASRDRRRDPQGSKGKHTKGNPDLLARVQHWLHVDATLTHGEARARANAEILRECAERALRSLPESCQTDDTSVLLSDASVRAEYERLRIKSDKTIANWVRPLVRSRKHVPPPQQGSANTADSMKRRLSYARGLLAALADPTISLVFVDEVPFYLAPPPRTPRAALAADSGQPADMRSSVCLAVHATAGLLHAECAMPRKQVRIKKPHNPTRPALCAARCSEAFRERLDGVLQRILERPDLIKGKTLFLVIDNATDHGEPAEREALFRASAASFEARLRRLDCTLKVVQMPEHSPHLSLCEYYCVELRAIASRLHAEALLSPSALPASKRAQLAAGKCHLLEALLSAGLEALARASPPRATHAFRASLQQVVAREGFLDTLVPLLPVP